MCIVYTSKFCKDSNNLITNLYHITFNRYKKKVLGLVVVYLVNKWFGEKDPTFLNNTYLHKFVVYLYLY